MDPWKIVWTLQAIDDMRSIGGFIAQGSEGYASAQIQRFLTAADRLRDFPEMGRMVPEINDRVIRELIVGRYRMLYRLRNNSVEMIAVIHGARDLIRALENREN